MISRVPETITFSHDDHEAPADHDDSRDSSCRRELRDRVIAVNSFVAQRLYDGM
jgi:hypothetical protein